MWFNKLWLFLKGNYHLLKKDGYYQVTVVINKIYNSVNNLANSTKWSW